MNMKTRIWKWTYTVPTYDHILYSKISNAVNRDLTRDGKVWESAAVKYTPECHNNGGWTELSPSDVRILLKKYPDKEDKPQPAPKRKAAVRVNGRTLIIFGVPVVTDHLNIKDVAREVRKAIKANAGK